MSNKRIVHLGELRLTKADVALLGKEELAFLTTLSFAMNEITVFLRLLLDIMGSEPSDPELQLHWIIQKNTIARALTLKVFEAMAIPTKHLEKRKKTGEGLSESIIAEFEAALKPFKMSKFYKVAKVIRDDATGHIIPQTTQKNIPFVSERSVFELRFNEKAINSHFPAGEEYVFLGRLNRFYQEELGEDYNASEVSAWIAWIAEVAKSLLEIHQKYLMWLIQDRLPHVRLRKKTPYLEMDHVLAAGEKGKSPLFVSFEDFLAKKAISPIQDSDAAG